MCSRDARSTDTLPKPIKRQFFVQDNVGISSFLKNKTNSSRCSAELTYTVYWYSNLKYKKNQSHSNLKKKK